MGLSKTYIFSYIDYSSTLKNSSEIGYSIIKNGGKSREYLTSNTGLIKDSFEKMSFDCYVALCNKLFNTNTYKNLSIPRFASEKVHIQSMGIYSFCREPMYRKYIFEDCFFDFSKIDDSCFVFVKDVSCTKMVDTPIWECVDKKLLSKSSSEIFIFTVRINRENTPTMCSLVISE